MTTQGSLGYGFTRESQRGVSPGQNIRYPLPEPKISNPHPNYLNPQDPTLNSDSVSRYPILIRVIRPDTRSSRRLSELPLAWPARRVSEQPAPAQQAKILHRPATLPPSLSLSCVSMVPKSRNLALHGTDAGRCAERRRFTRGGRGRVVENSRSEVESPRTRGWRHRATADHTLSPRAPPLACR